MICVMGVYQVCLTQGNAVCRRLGTPERKRMEKNVRRREQRHKLLSGRCAREDPNLQKQTLWARAGGGGRSSLVFRRWYMRGGGGVAEAGFRLFSRK